MYLFRLCIAPRLYGTSAPECPGLVDLDNLSVLSEGEVYDNSISNLEAFYGFHDQEGDKVDDKLIQIVDAGLCKKPDEAKTKDLLEQYPKPVNSKNLRVPKTNVKVWKLLTKNQRLRDIRLQKSQTIITKSLTASVKLLAGLREARKGNSAMNLKCCINIANDIVRLNSASYSDLSALRKDNMRSGLADVYKPLCGDLTTQSDSTELLFGLISQKIKDLGESSKMASNIGAPKNFNRSRPYKFQSGSDSKQPKYHNQSRRRFAGQKLGGKQPFSHQWKAKNWPL
ncbi:hypothetical protein EGW08_011392 [Elysia chlorotica]|uniref:Uncharacterized protein n=1 Tax=Elysia chlorotica TaxID=188477 RepID=A0A433TGW7_ELYCH|nr:hypothetical protein EGW08_011392 [Elysia chlorotica]